MLSRFFFRPTMQLKPKMQYRIQQHYTTTTQNQINQLTSNPHPRPTFQTNHQPWKPSST